MCINVNVNTRRISNKTRLISILGHETICQFFLSLKCSRLTLLAYCALVCTTSARTFMCVRYHVLRPLPSMSTCLPLGPWLQAQDRSTAQLKSMDIAGRSVLQRCIVRLPRLQAVSSWQFQSLKDMARTIEIC